MGIETALIIGTTVGLGALKANAAMDQAKAEAKAKVAEGNIAAKNKSQETILKAARIQTSFLNSGLTLDGTPMAAIQNTFDVGKEDVSQIISNTNTASKNIMKAGRSAAISSIAESAVSAFGGMGLGSGTMSAMDFGLETGGQGFFNGGFGNMIGSAQGKYGPGF